MAPQPPLLPLLGLLLFTLAAGRITHREISHDDRQLIVIEMPFGFGDRGTVTVELRLIHVAVPYGQQGLSTQFSKEDKHQVGMFIAPAAEETVMAEDLFQNGCPLDHVNSVLLRFDDPGIQINSQDKEAVFTASLVPPSKGQYALYFAQCMPQTVEVSFEAKIMQFNTDAKGNIDYLSVGERELPTVFLVSPVCSVNVSYPVMESNLLGVIWRPNLVHVSVLRCVVGS